MYRKLICLCWCRYVPYHRTLPWLHYSIVIIAWPTGKRNKSKEMQFFLKGRNHQVLFEPLHLPQTMTNWSSEIQWPQKSWLPFPFPYLILLFYLRIRPSRKEDNWSGQLFFSFLQVFVWNSSSAGLPDCLFLHILVFLTRKIWHPCPVTMLFVDSSTKAVFASLLTIWLCLCFLTPKQENKFILDIIEEICRFWAFHIKIC
jgi:hypothetical protein